MPKSSFVKLSEVRANGYKGPVSIRKSTAILVEETSLTVTNPEPGEGQPQESKVNCRLIALPDSREVFVSESQDEVVAALEEGLTSKLHTDRQEHRPTKSSTVSRRR